MSYIVNNVTSDKINHGLGNLGGSLNLKLNKKELDELIKSYSEIAAEACFSGITERNSICMYIYNRKVIFPLEESFLKLCQKHKMFIEADIYNSSQLYTKKAFSGSFRFSILGRGNPKIVITLSFFDKPPGAYTGVWINTYINSSKNVPIVIQKSNRLQHLFYKRMDGIFNGIHSRSIKSKMRLDEIHNNKQPNKNKMKYGTLWINP